MPKQKDIWSYTPLWGNWYIDGEIGVGGSSRVYKGYRNIGERQIDSAIKWMVVESNPQLDGDVGLRRIESEINRLYDLKNCHQVIHYEDHLIEKRADGTGYDVFLRMELAEPIKMWMQKKGMTLRQLVLLGREIAASLESCSKCGIIHRDVKLDNLFVDPSGQFKLGDFGIAANHMSQDGKKGRGGSPLYLAPEVLAGSASSMQSDQFALGRCLQYILCGCEKADLNLTDFLKESFLKETPESLKAILSSCLAYQPQNRYERPEDLKLAFDQILGALSNQQEAIWILRPTEKCCQQEESTLFRAQIPEKSKGKGYLHAFWSPYVAGKTTLACNLAYALSLKSNKDIALLDFDREQKSVFYHFPIQFDHVGKRQAVWEYGRYRRLCEAVDHGRLFQKLKTYAYSFGRLDVFALHRDIEFKGSDETLLKVLHQALAEYDEVVLDLPRNAGIQLLNYVSEVSRASSYMVVTPDSEILNGLLSKFCTLESCIQTWLRGSRGKWIANKNTHFSKKHYELFLKSKESPASFQIHLVPEDYTGAIEVKYKGAMLYDSNMNYRKAINELSEVKTSC